MRKGRHVTYNADPPATQGGNMNAEFIVRRVGACIAVMLSLCAQLTHAEVREVRIAQQFGVAYLPLMVMKNAKLIERQADKLGVGPLNVTWNTFGSGADMNTALLAGALDFASGGVGPVLQIWGRTRGNIDVRGVASLGSLPLYLNTINPGVKTIGDFSGRDKIALPAVKVSIQAVILQMAAAQMFGDSNYGALDNLTVSMSHPQATAALLSGGTEITAHFTNSPFQEQQLQDSRVRRVLDSYAVLGGPSTLNSLYATSKFRAENPKVYAAVVAALREAMDIINRDKMAAAKLYVEEEKSKLTPEFVYKVISDPQFIFTVTPQGFMKFADFMYKTEALKVKPSSWKDVFFPEVHNENGG
jgi:NitT/TauT family transport system substrate-binding protein